MEDVKLEIKRLKRLKLECRAGSSERITLHRQIKALKEKLAQENIIEPNKLDIIVEIQTLRPEFLQLDIDLNKFTILQLQKHLDRIKANKDIRVGIKTGG